MVSTSDYEEDSNDNGFEEEGMDISSEFTQGNQNLSENDKVDLKQEEQLFLRLQTAFRSLAQESIIGKLSVCEMADMKS